MFSGVVNRFSVTVWLACSVVAVVAGPFGTHDSMSFALRSIYWSSAIALSIFMAHGLRTGLRLWFPGLSRNWRDVIVPPVFSILFSGLVDGANHLILESVVHDLSHLSIFLFVLALSIMVTLLRRFLEVEAPSYMPVAPETVATPALQRRPRLYDRIEAGPAMQIRRLTVADHYVIVHLDDGTTRKLLMRFSDAVDAMSGQPGLYTHRSHWVSLDIVSRVIRDGAREVVLLEDGTRVPLTRTYRAGFEARGLVTRTPVRGPVSAE